MFAQPFLHRLFPLLFSWLVLPVNAMDVPSVNVPMYQHGTQTLYVAGSIAGYGETEFMVDTGASYLALNETTIGVLLENGEAVFVKHLSARMADGRTAVIPIYQITRLKIGDRCTIENVEAAMLPGKTRNILGLSALRKASPFMLDLEAERLMLSQCQSSDI